MKFLTKPQCSPWIRFSLVCLPFVVAACDRAEQGTGRRQEMRCAQDGVCWQPVGKRSLEGAYRKGEKEFKFDAVFSPGRSWQTNYKDEWSYRLMDQQGVVFFTANSSNPPPGWSDEDKQQQHIPSDPEQHMQYLRDRNSFATEMARAMQASTGPEGHLDAPWKQLCRHLDLSFATVPTQTIKASLSRSKMMQEADSGSAPDEALAELAPQESEPMSEEWSGESLLDDEEAHEDLADGVRVEEHEQEVVDAMESTDHQPEPHALSTLGFSRQKNKHTHPAELQRHEGFEFQQDMQLFWKHTRSFLIGGWKTGKHHTAACINVKKRRLNSDEPWALYDRVCTENHGSKAGEGEMKLYANCYDMPITKEWFVWKGECGGKYPTHFCNDDTALQIRHAYGLYDDGKKCLKRKRTHRPWCEQPW